MTGNFNNLVAFVFYQPLTLSPPWNTLSFTHVCVSQIAIPKNPNKLIPYLQPSALFLLFFFWSTKCHNFQILDLRYEGGWKVSCISCNLAVPSSWEKIRLPIKSILDSSTLKTITTTKNSESSFHWIVLNFKSWKRSTISQSYD